MYMIDFEYDGEMLSQYDCVPGFINNSNDENTPMRSNLALTTVKSNDINSLINVSYDETLTKTFDIVKNNCGETSVFNDEEIRLILGWLDKGKYCKFKPIYNDANYYDVFFKGIFSSINVITLDGEVIGFNLTIETNAPFGFSGERYQTHTLSTQNDTFCVDNYSEISGYTYPDKVIIKCITAGDIKITNSLDKDNVVMINNCSVGEIITLDCVHKIITSNKAHDTLHNDFNYNWLRLVGNSEICYNYFTLDVAKLSDAEITIEYTPIRKVGIIV